jgi:hypothetical protein
MFGIGSGESNRRVSVAQPVNNHSSKRQAVRDSDSDSDDAGSRASLASGRGGNNRGSSGLPPTVSATSTTNGGGSQNASNPQPLPTGSTGAAGSQPIYASGQTPSARELALSASADETRTAMQGKDPLKALKKIFKKASEVRMVVPKALWPTDKSNPYWRICEQKWLMQIPIRHLDLRLEPCARDNGLGRLDQMTFVTRLLDGCNNLSKSGSPGVTLDLDVPMRTLRAQLMPSEQMYTCQLHRTIAESKVIGCVRIRDYGPELDRASWLPNGDELLGANPNINSLELLDCEFDDDDISQLTRALGENKFIKKLVFNNCTISISGEQELTRLFMQRPDMQVVGFHPRQVGSLAQPCIGDGKGSAKLKNNPASPASASTTPATGQIPVNTTSSSNTTASTTNATTTAPTATPTATPASSSITSTTGKPAGRFHTVHSNAVHEQELANAAAEAQAAFKQDDPAPALKRLFDQRADVRIEIPAKILWKACDANGVGDGYEKFSSAQLLSSLKLRNIEFLPQPCQAGESQFSQFDFLAYTLDSLKDLPKKSCINTSLAIVLPDTRTAEAISVDIVRAQDSLFRSLANDRLTARLDLGSLAPRTEGSIALCRFFESLSAKTRLVELKLCGAVLSRAETLVLAEGLRKNESIQVLDLTDTMLDPGVREQFYDAVKERSDLKMMH